MASHFVGWVVMSSQHAQPWRGFRPDPDEYDAAEALLDERGASVSAYLRACLRWLQQAPEAALEAVGPHSPPPRRRGRPRARPGSDESRSGQAEPAGVDQVHL